MYKEVVQIVYKMSKKKQEPFRKRLKAIMTSANGIGWGYYDDLCYYYSEAFE